MQLGVIGLGKMEGFIESLIRRIRSREENSFNDRMVAIRRNASGRHAVKKD